MWLRYNTFFVLYPVGIASECWLVFLATKPAAKWDWRIECVLWLALSFYGPGEYTMRSGRCGGWVSANAWCRGVDPVHAYDDAEAESYAWHGCQEETMIRMPRLCNLRKSHKKRVHALVLVSVAFVDAMNASISRQCNILRHRDPSGLSQVADSLRRFENNTRAKALCRSLPFCSRAPGLSAHLIVDLAVGIDIIVFSCYLWICCLSCLPALTEFPELAGSSFHWGVFEPLRWLGRAHSQAVNEFAPGYRF
jgi:hypothetical protein